MTFKVTLVGAHAHEPTPAIALYAVEPNGRVGEKLAAVVEGQLALPRGRKGAVALGPDVENAASLDPKGLVTMRLADQLPIWERDKEIQIPSQWWRGWLGFTTCVSGSVSRCWPILLEQSAMRAMALGQRPIIFPEHCAPLCNGVVEVWESTTCCWPFLIYDVPKVIAGLEKFLAENPIMFPVPPLPNPGPVEGELASRVDRALGAGKVSTSFVPHADLSAHLETLKSLTAREAVDYVEANPALWWFWCDSTTAMLGETPLNLDGSFSFCYRWYPFFFLNCRTSYFYKVKQFVGGVWTYVYDGAAAHQYFTADQIANIATQTGVVCVQPPPLPAGAVTLQAIGATDAWDINSHWAGADGGGNDLTQTGAALMPIATPDAGLLLADGAPWTETLYLSLNFDEGMKSAGAVYYRLSTVQADLAGNPIGAPQPIGNAVSWNYLDISSFPPVTRMQPLGPVTPSGSPNAGLFTIPYFSDQDWLGLANGPAGLFHQYLDTTTLQNPTVGGTGNGNGRFMVILEVFDSGGARLVPAGVTAAPGDITASFSFVRLLGAPPSASLPGPVSVVNQVSLAHMLWVDNRPVVGHIDYFQSSAGTQECQFISASADTDFYVGYYAYHTVMCDNPALSPVPSSTFMASYSMTWQEGLGGSSGTLDSGGDINNPNSCPAGSADAVTPGTTFATMLAGQTACAFAITLTVAPKHTNGFGTVGASSWNAAVALSIV